jgi:hypothetical protein
MDEWQVFIAFKHLDKNGNQTLDSILAHRIHDYLTKKGLKVFNSSVSLKKSGTAEYKRAIDKALDCASILVAVSTSIENLNSKWVHYEWDSFFNDILSEIKPEGRIFTYIDSINTNDLPRALRLHQAFLHSNESLKNLYDYIINALGSSNKDSNKKKGVAEEGQAIESFLLKKILGEGPQLVNIPFNQKITIGKMRENKVVLSSKGISRYHAEIFHNKKGLFLNDLNSTNGTYVNDARIKFKALKENDVVEFDIIKYKVLTLSGKQEVLNGKQSR